MVGQADYYSAFIKWFETKAWHTEQETIDHVIESFLKRRTNPRLDDGALSAPFPKMILKRIVEKTNPQFRQHLTDKISLSHFSRLINELIQEMSLSLFGHPYQDLPTEEHRKFILENLDLPPEEAKSFLASIAHQIIKRINSELSDAQKTSLEMIELILSRDQFSNQYDFWLHLYVFKKSYETLKEKLISLNSQPISDLFLDYKRAVKCIDRAETHQSHYLKLNGQKNMFKFNLVILPPNIACLHKLRILLLDQNTLSFLPPQIGDLIHLKQLSLRENTLTYLPQTFQKLTNLTHLILRQNHLRDLPDGFEKLTKLRILDLAINRLSHFPIALHGLSALMELNLSVNPLDSFPLKANSKPLLTFLGIKLITVSLIESRELAQLRNQNCKIAGGKTKSLLEALPNHLFLLLMTFLPWRSLHKIAGLNQYFHLAANNLIHYRSQISEKIFFQPFHRIDDVERRFLTRHLNQTSHEIAIKLTNIIQEIEQICKMIQNQIVDDIEFDEDGHEIESHQYTIEEIKDGLSYQFFQDDQEAFLNHLHQFLESIKRVNAILNQHDKYLKLCEAFYSYQHLLYQIRRSRQSCKSFSFVNSALTMIPPEISRLQKLEKLTLIELFLTSLPDHLLHLPHLRKIYLNGNLFTEIPQVLFRCHNLNTLAIMKNDIRSIPDHIQDLTNLEILSFQQNYIQRLPNSISALPRLKALNLTENQIETLPDSITNLSSLTTLKIDLKWESLSPEQMRWLLRLREQNSKIIGIQMPNHLLKIPAMIQAIETELKSIRCPQPYKQIEESFSPEVFGENLYAFLHYLQQFCNTIKISNGLIPQQKKRQINPTELPYAYKGYTLCLDYIDQCVRSKSERFTLLNTFNTLNTLTFLPLKIRDLRHVKHMDLRNNRLIFVHPEIWNLPLLESLELSFNQLTRLPDGIDASTNLQVLTLYRNPLEVLPKGIHKTNLKVLEIDDTIIQMDNLSEDQKFWLQDAIDKGITTGISHKK